MKNEVLQIVIKVKVNVFGSLQSFKVSLPYSLHVSISLVAAVYGETMRIQRREWMSPATKWNETD